MVSIDEMQQMLSLLLDELPPELFAELNGGISLLDEEKADPSLDDIYVMGEYIEDLLGRSIVLYYGSFMQMFDDCTDEELRQELRATLRHELRHHIESLAGVDDLGAEDEAEMERFREEDRAQREPTEREVKKTGLHERLRGLFGGARHN